MTAAAMIPPAGKYPKVRRVRFRFGEPDPMSHHFVEGDIVMSHLVAVLSAAFPPGEESFIRSVRRFSDEITDPELKRRVAGFIGQESVHGQEHRKLNDRLIELGYPAVRVFMFKPNTWREKLVKRVENAAHPLAHLAMTAAAEHYTAILGERVLSSDELQSIPGDPEVWHLLNWHATEELEHKSVAFDVYRSVGGPEWIRIGVMSAMWAGTLPVVSLGVLGSILTDPKGWKPATVLRQTYDVFRGPLVRGLLRDVAKYMRPGFHPDDIDTGVLLERWQQELFGDQGVLAGHGK